MSIIFKLNRTGARNGCRSHDAIGLHAMVSCTRESAEAVDSDARKGTTVEPDASGCTERSASGTT